LIHNLMEVFPLSEDHLIDVADGLDSYVGQVLLVYYLLSLHQGVITKLLMVLNLILKVIIHAIYVPLE